jgi:DHA3 family macrolide efflux protein-like MFS transporter
MSESSEAEKPSPYSVFRNRDFTALWLGDLISQFGNGITSIAASILVYQETGSALSVGLMLIATSLPGFLFGLIAGVFVDRLDRKRIMLVCEVLRAVIVFLIPVMLPFGIWWLYILVALSATVTQFFNPAHASVIPDVASDEELAAANSMMSISHTGALGLGFAAAGLITARFNVEWAFYVDAITFLLSGVAILLVKLPPMETPEEKTSVEAVARNLRAGLRFLWDSKILRSTFIVIVPMAVLFGLHNSLLLPFADRALGATEFEYGLIEGLSMVGFVVGGLVMAGIADRLREGQWIAISFIGMGIANVIYSQLSAVSLAIVVGMIMSFMNVPSFIGRQLVIQRNTTREVRGRVTSAYYVTRDVTFMIGMGLAALADYIDVRVLILGEALLLMGLGVVVLFMPGLGQPAAEWRRIIGMLRKAPEAPGLEAGRVATLADFDRLAGRLPALSALSVEERTQLAAESQVTEAPAGTTIIRMGEVSDAAYFLLEGRTFAGWEEGGSYRVLEVHSAGDFFGEIAALTGIPRTAYVVAEEPSTLLMVPADGLREMTSKPELNRVFLEKMTERMVRMDLLDIPRKMDRDQKLLRELRTPEPQLEAAPA